MGRPVLLRLFEPGYYGSNIYPIIKFGVAMGILVEATFFRHRQMCEAVTVCLATAGSPNMLLVARESSLHKYLNDSDGRPLR